ncbi:hypothetical protein [Aquibium microcysteis]|uniref:hypothetical protein n=1 Tax=Aquibium microcysteis TaxID=675281 RepID=UPI00165CF1F4|nr:hypothetical protein [Aquibium microcysteis]
MSGRILATAALLALCPTPLLAQNAAALSGTWRCVMNSVPATVETTVYLAPDFSAVADGIVILNGTSGYFPYTRASGRWSIGPGDNGQAMVRIQIAPPNQAMFSLFVIPRDMNNMYNYFAHQDARVETACQRIR